MDAPLILSRRMSAPVPQRVPLLLLLPRHEAVAYVHAAAATDGVPVSTIGAFLHPLDRKHIGESTGASDVRGAPAPRPVVWVEEAHAAAPLFVVPVALFVTLRRHDADLLRTVLGRADVFGDTLAPHPHADRTHGADLERLADALDAGRPVRKSELRALAGADADLRALLVEGRAVRVPSAHADEDTWWDAVRVVRLEESRVLLHGTPGGVGVLPWMGLRLALRGVRGARPPIKHAQQWAFGTEAATRALRRAEAGEHAAASCTAAAADKFPFGGARVLPLADVHISTGEGRVVQGVFAFVVHGTRNSLAIVVRGPPPAVFYAVDGAAAADTLCDGTGGTIPCRGGHVLRVGARPRAEKTSELAAHLGVRAADMSSTRELENAVLGWLLKEVDAARDRERILRAMHAVHTSDTGPIVDAHPHVDAPESAAGASTSDALAGHTHAAPRSVDSAEWGDAELVAPVKRADGVLPFLSMFDAVAFQHAPRNTEVHLLGAGGVPVRAALDPRAASASDGGKHVKQTRAIDTGALLALAATTLWDADGAPARSATCPDLLDAVRAAVSREYPALDNAARAVLGGAQRVCVYLSGTNAGEGSGSGGGSSSSSTSPEAHHRMLLVAAPAPADPAVWACIQFGKDTAPLPLRFPLRALLRLYRGKLDKDARHCPETLFAGVHMDVRETLARTPRELVPQIARALDDAGALDSTWCALLTAHAAHAAHALLPLRDLPFAMHLGAFLPAAREMLPAVRLHADVAWDGDTERATYTGYASGAAGERTVHLALSGASPPAPDTRIRAVVLRTDTHTLETASPHTLYADGPRHADIASGWHVAIAEDARALALTLDPVRWDPVNPAAEYAAALLNHPAARLAAHLDRPLLAALPAPAAARHVAVVECDRRDMSLRLHEGSDALHFLLQRPPATPAV